MDRTSRAQQGAVRAVLTYVARYPQGISVDELRANISGECEWPSDDAIAIAAAQGWIERSPIFGDRLRWARPDGLFKQAAAWVRLRTSAKPLLATIHQHSGLPVTLHVLVGRAHAVIERYPADLPAKIVEEVARYSTPRPLTNGMTSRVLLACMPPEIDEAGLLEQHERDAVGRRGFGYAVSTKAGGGVLSAPIRAVATGLPLAALCTFGELQRFSPDGIAEIGALMRDAADRLAAESTTDAPLLLEATEALVSRI